MRVGPQTVDQMLYASIMVYYSVKMYSVSSPPCFQNYTFNLLTNSIGTMTVVDYGCGLEVVTH